MKQWFSRQHTRAALALGAMVTAASLAHAGVQVSVNEAGFYGRVSIGQQPVPTVIYQQPVIVQQSPVAIVQQPIYMRVPQAHYEHWAQHCGYWRACGQPVLFVRGSGQGYFQPRQGWRHEGDREERWNGRWRGRWEERLEERREERREQRREEHHGRGHHDRD